MPEHKSFADTACASCKKLRISLFQDIPSADLEKLSAGKTCTTYKKGSVFMHEGSRPNGVFCLNRGKVKIYKHGDGREQIIKIAKEGDLLGYRAILAEEQFPVSAKTLEDCNMCFIPKQVFLDTIFSSTSFAQKILKEACHELDVMTEVLTNMAQKTVRERVALTLYMLSDTYGENGDGEGHSVINLKREDLAGLVGTATETLIRLLSEFKEEHLIEVQGRKIIVKDKAALRKIARTY